MFVNIWETRFIAIFDKKTTLYTMNIENVSHIEMKF